jgi:FkbM family methyltransferase
MTVIDIGANIGAHTLPLARLVGPPGTVLACEPTDWAVAKLLRNLALNPALRERVAVHQVMLGADDTVTVPESIPASWPMAGGADVHPKLRGRAMPTKGATASTLDRVLDACGVAKVDFIKLDVDGDECAVLDGAKKTLRQSRPTILMELSPYALEERGGSVERLATLFEETDYQLFHLDGKQTLPRAPAELRRCVADGASRNIMAAPYRSPDAGRQGARAERRDQALAAADPEMALTATAPTVCDTVLVKPL